MACTCVLQAITKFNGDIIAYKEKLKADMEMSERAFEKDVGIPSAGSSIAAKKPTAAAGKTLAPIAKGAKAKK
jgi:hypothetical protein